MEWHWVPLAVIGAILWIIQNVRNQQPPAAPPGRRQGGGVPLPSRRPESVPAVPRAIRKHRERQEREAGQTQPAARPRLPVVSPPPVASLPPSPWSEPPALPAAVSAGRVRPAAMPSPPPASASSSARQAVALVKKPGSAAVAFVLREILDEPLCKRGRGRRR